MGKAIAYGNRIKLGRMRLWDLVRTSVGLMFNHVLCVDRTPVNDGGRFNFVG